MHNVDPVPRHFPRVSRSAMLVSLLAMLLSAPLAPVGAQESSDTPPDSAVTPESAASAQASAQAAAQAAPCMASDVARQLDFWVGTWDVYNPEGQQVGMNVVEQHLGGCLLLENWTGARGSEGKSMNYWDPQRGTWRQVWVSDRGNVLDYRAGEYRDGAMRFRGITIAESGDTVAQKLTFENVAPDTVRQVFEASRDGGMTWDTTWVGLYIRRSGDGGH